MKLLEGGASEKDQALPYRSTRRLLLHPSNLQSAVSDRGIDNNCRFADRAIVLYGRPPDARRPRNVIECRAVRCRADKGFAPNANMGGRGFR